MCVCVCVCGHVYVVYEDTNLQIRNAPSPVRAKFRCRVGVGQ